MTEKGFCARTPTALRLVSKVLCKCQALEQTRSSEGRSSEQGRTVGAVGPRPGGGVEGGLSLRAWRPSARAEHRDSGAPALHPDPGHVL